MGRTFRPAPAALLVCLLAAGCGSTPAVPPPPAGGPLDRVVYVVDRGWHTDVGFPADEVSGPAAAVARDFPGVRYLVFGFGDRRYFQDPHPGLGETVIALFPDRGVLLATALKAPPADAFGAGNAVALPVSAASVAAMMGRLSSDFETGPDGKPRQVGPGPYPGSQFYASTGTYDALYTCNTWTADVLHAGGIDIFPAGKVFAGQVMDRVRQLAGTGRGAFSVEITPPAAVQPPDR